MTHRDLRQAHYEADRAVFQKVNACPPIDNSGAYKVWKDEWQALRKVADAAYDACLAAGVSGFS